MISDLIEKKPWIIIVVWLIIVAFMAPLALHVNNVVKTQTESFLPSKVESVRAEEFLKSIRETNGSMSMGSGDYMLVVHGVPVNLETYYKLKNKYYSLGENGSYYSWIDVINNVEEKLRKASVFAINNTVLAVKGILEVNNAYKGLYRGLNRTSIMLVSIDRIYSNLYRGLDKVAKEKTMLDNLEDSYYALCNQMLPAAAMTWYDVVRTVYILSNMTSSYNTGMLTPMDVRVIVSLTNLTNVGVGPVPPIFVETIYNATAPLGGVSQIDNRMASLIAHKIFLMEIKSKAGGEKALELAEIAWNVWNDSLSQIPDYRMIFNHNGISRGQLVLLNILMKQIQPLRKEAVEKLSIYYNNTFGGDAGELASLIGEKILEKNFTKSDSNDIAVQAVLDYMAGKGLPKTQLARKAVTQALLTGDIDSRTVMQLALQTITRAMEKSGQAKSNPSMQKLEPLAEVLLEEDPDGRGVLLNNTNITNYLSAVIMLRSQGFKVNNTVLKSLKKSSGSIREEAIVLLKSMVGKEDKVALKLIDMLEEKNLLGVHNETLLAEAPRILSQTIMKTANVTQVQADKIVRLAVMVFRGDVSLNKASDNLTSDMIKNVFPEILSELKGLMVEKDARGFIVAYNPDKKTGMDEAATKLILLSKKLKNILESEGYVEATVHLGGTEYMAWEMKASAKADIERSDRVSMVLVIIILALVLESIAAVILPFIGIGMGLIASIAVAYLLATHGIIDITTHSRTIMYTTGLGLGIDYAAYVGKRFREAASEGLESRKAARRAFQNSWKAVTAGAVTAAIGFGSMLAAKDFPFITSIGTNVPLTILGVMLASITFIPALLAYLGEREWFWWPRHPIEKGLKSKEKTLSYKIAKPITQRPWIPIVIIAIMAVGAYAIMAGFQGSYDISLNLPRTSESAFAIKEINRYYDPGVLYPLYIIVHDTGKTDTLVQSINSTPGVSKVYVPKQYNGKIVYVYMSLNPLGPDGLKLAGKIRYVAHSIDPESLVGGMSAINLDLKDMINKLFYHRVYPIAIILMFVTLLVAYGSIIMAASAVVGVALAAYVGSGLTVLVYQKLLGQPVLWYLPVIVFTAILGVGMDYNSFSISRAQEECRIKCNSDSLLEALRHSIPTVLGLSLIMAGAYLGLAATRTPGLSEMGTALVLGVLLAGINASLLLTPPLIAIFREKAWWPGDVGRRRTDEREGAFRIQDKVSGTGSASP